MYKEKLEELKLRQKELSELDQKIIDYSSDIFDIFISEIFK